MRTTKDYRDLARSIDGPGALFNVYKGTDADDYFEGTNRDDRFIPGAGDNGVDGRGGYDTLVLDFRQAGNYISGDVYSEGVGSFSGSIGTFGDSTGFESIENIVFRGSKYGDFLSVNAASIAGGGTFNFFGGSGFDTLFCNGYGLDGDIIFKMRQDGSIRSNLGHYASFEEVTLLLGSGNNDVSTLQGNDTIQGGMGTNSIRTGAGDDFIVSRGIDTVDGGQGYDHWEVSHGDNVGDTTYYVNDTNVLATDGTTAKRVEDITIYAGHGNDTFVISGGGTYRLDGGEGINTFSLDEFSGGLTALIGSIGVSSSGILRGSFVNSNQGGLYLTLDNFQGASITGTANDDDLGAGFSGRILSENIHIDGGAGTDHLNLGLSDSNRHVSFVVNADGSVTTNLGTYLNFETYFIAGAEGKDHIVTGNGIDTIYGGFGNDRISGGGASDTLYGDAGDDIASGGSGADSVFGGDGNDVIKGGAGGDYLFGDNLFGEAGYDVLTGGRGADDFVFFEGQTDADPSKADRITDFNQSDHDYIELSQFDADTTSDEEAFRFIGNAKFDGQAGELRYQVTDGSTFVSGDTNGDGTADFTIRLDGEHALVATDFIL